MPRFQLAAAIVLASSATFSAILFFWLSPPSEGKIELPTLNDSDDELEPEISGESDPFLVTHPEDFVDGIPIDEDKFWVQARMRKIFLALICSALIVVDTATFGYSLASQSSSSTTISFILRALFDLYLLLLTGLAIPETRVPHHWVAIVHIASLETSALTLCFVASILPETGDVQASHAKDQDEWGVPSGLWYMNFALTALAVVISSTTPRGPKLHFPSERIYSKKTLATSHTCTYDNVCGLADASVLGFLHFSYTTKVVMLGFTSESLEIGDLPIVTADMRATTLFYRMRTAMRTIKLEPMSILPSFLFAGQPRWQWKPKTGSGFGVMYRLARINSVALAVQMVLGIASTFTPYAPLLFLQKLIKFLEAPKDGPVKDIRWGLLYCAGLFLGTAIGFLITEQLWSISFTTLQVRMRVQLNSILFAKTLVRKDVASSSSSSGSNPVSSSGKNSNGVTVGSQRPPDSLQTPEGQMVRGTDEEDEFSSKAQIMTLMTTDVDRVSKLSAQISALSGSLIETLIGMLFLYKLLGVSCFVGLGVTCLLLPLNHWAGKVIIAAQENLMKARDRRVSLMNEILGAIRMLKFMAWERSFEKKVIKIREDEMRYQMRNYIIETLWSIIWDASPVIVTIFSFWHFAVTRQQALTPDIAFTSIAVFTEMKFALTSLPETLINMLQSLVSIRRIERYLNLTEVAHVPSLESQDLAIAFKSATVTWPQDREQGCTRPTSASALQNKFVLSDLTLDFPAGEMSLVCGKIGSGKTLLLLALLGEADLLSGEVRCPRSPPDAIASLQDDIPPPEKWVVHGLCAYVPQAAWLRNASIRENILFNLPYVEERYNKTLEVCALVSDLELLEDGDLTEIGESGVNLSGGQKARVSLARAVYSRASILLLDDVLSAVDTHTAHHLYEKCLRGELLSGRSVILVSNHVQLCVPGASYVVALENGWVTFAGDGQTFRRSGVMDGLVQSDNAKTKYVKTTTPRVTGGQISSGHRQDTQLESESSSTASPTSKEDRKPQQNGGAPRKLVEEERRARGRISLDIWKMYFRACGGRLYWTLFVISMAIAAASPVLENGWLKTWTGAVEKGQMSRSTVFYISIFAGVTIMGQVFSTIRFLVLYSGSIQASTVLYKRLLETVLFAHIRFHDTVSRGRLLNRFGKDFEGIDSSLSDNFGRSIINGLAVIVTVITVTIVGGLPFLLAITILGYLYYSVAKVYGQTSRDMRRLDSVTTSPLYSIYGETISGVAILRAFGAGSKFLRDMLRAVDTNTNPYFWMWSLNRWFSIQFSVISSAVVGITGLVVLKTPSIDASLAGFTLAFASTVTINLVSMVRRFVGLEQSLVAVERVKEYSELSHEAPEFIEPRPAAGWPSKGECVVENLCIRYAPELPNVLHNLTFTISPGEHVGILGRTGCGKSTLALSFFRFVEASEGRILIDGLDISKLGITDLRSRLTIIPQDPTILSGTLRSTLDVFEEYEDSEIFMALRRVHLLPSAESPEHWLEMSDDNVFCNLESPVSEGGENFSTGEKQLICLARAILKRPKVLLMDEATASVDYATDEVIGKTIRHEFSDSTILTIAHRLRTVVDYDRVMLLDEGRIVEFDRPAILLSNPNTRFHALCKATGNAEFTVLKHMAGILEP